MVTDCIVKEFDVYDGENKDIADKMKSLLNDGYKVDVKYSIGNMKSVLLVAIKEEDEKIRTTKTTKKKEELKAAAE